jgi:hypothetical protein
MEKIPYLGLPNCYRLTNGDVEVVVATDVGPRILRYGFPGEENVLGEVPEAAKTTALGEWKPWGGHRLWAAPEAVPRTYHPDNAPVEAAGDRLTARLAGPVEVATGLRKEMAVALCESGTDVVVTHRVWNLGLWPVEIAPWALTVVRGGGFAVVPQESYAPHGDETLLPVRSLVLWSYSDLGDPRFGYSRKYVFVRCDPQAGAAVKLGLSNSLGWLAYALGGAIFVKRFAYDPAAAYPDRGSNAEVFTAGGYMELESLGPLSRVEPGAAAEHVERWSLHRCAALTPDEAAVDAVLAQIVGHA